VDVPGADGGVVGDGESAVSGLCRSGVGGVADVEVVGREDAIIVEGKKALGTQCPDVDGGIGGDGWRIWIGVGGEGVVVGIEVGGGIGEDAGAICEDQRAPGEGRRRWGRAAGRCEGVADGEAAAEVLKEGLRIGGDEGVALIKVFGVAGDGNDAAAAVGADIERRDGLCDGEAYTLLDDE